MRSRVLLWSMVLVILWGSFLTVAVAGEKKPAPATGQPASNYAAPREEVLKLWRDVTKGRFREGAQACFYDYGPAGMRNLYCYLSAVWPYDRLIAWSGQKPFIRGPHSAGRLDLEATDDFGHYNAEFVRWLREALLPAPDDQDFIRVTRPIFERYFKYTARAYYLAYDIVFANSGLLLEEERGYQERMAEGYANCMGFDHFYRAFPEEYYARYLGDNWYYGNVVECAFAFWIRRHLDGTWKDFHQGLERLLTAYDPGFIDSVRSDSDKLSPHLVVASNLKIKDRMLKNFLEDLGHRIEAHDWPAVLTFFSEENYAQQKQMGIGFFQYIEEGLGLGRVDNQLPERPGDAGDDARLNSIEKIAFTDHSEENGLLVIRGLVTLFDGSRRPVELFLRRKSTGGWKIEPALG